MPEKRITFLLNRVVQELNSSADGLLRAKYSITYSQFIFLVTLAEHPTLDVTRLAAALGVTKGAVSKRLDWFTQRGLTQTTQAAGDSKRVLISLTRQGQDLAKDSGDFLEQQFLSTMSKEPAVDYNLLAAEVRKISKALAAKKILP